MASFGAITTVAAHQGFQNASSTPHFHLHCNSRRDKPVAQLNVDGDWDQLEIDCYTQLSESQIDHPSLCWCTPPEYTRKRQLAVPPRHPSFDASHWSIILQSDPRHTCLFKMCHLLSLPKELRLEIWKYVLTDPSVPDLAVEITREESSPVKSSTRFPNPSIKTTLQPARNSPINVNLLRTNRFIYDEALPILYRSVKFTPVDLNGIFPLFLDSLSPNAIPHIRHVKLRIPLSLYDGDLFHWAITCAQVVKLEGLRDIEVEGLFSTFASKRALRGILYPLCKIKARKIFGIVNGDNAEELLANARRELQAQANVRAERTKAEAAARAEREATLETQARIQEETRKEERDWTNFPFPETWPLLSTCDATIENDIGQLPGIKQFEKELEEHFNTGDDLAVMHDEGEEDANIQIGDWDLVSLGSGASTPKARPTSALSEHSDESWTDTASTIAEMEGLTKGCDVDGVEDHKRIGDQ